MRKYVGVTIVELSYYGKLKKYFDLIARRLVRLKPSQLKQIVDARQKRIRNVTTPPVGGSADKVFFIDLIYFYTVLLELFPEDKKLRRSILNFKCLFENETRKDNCIGEGFINHDDDSANEDKFKMHGVSIFLPFNKTLSERTKIINCAYFGRSIVSEAKENDIPLFRFVKRTQWDEFVIKYLEVQST